MQRTSNLIDRLKHTKLTDYTHYHNTICKSIQMTRLHACTLRQSAGHGRICTSHNVRNTRTIPKTASDKFSLACCMDWYIHRSNPYYPQSWGTHLHRFLFLPHFFSLFNAYSMNHLPFHTLARGLHTFTSSPVLTVLSCSLSQHRAASWCSAAISISCGFDALI